VYALGAMLYEMLTGRPPFRGATTLETLDQVRSQEPVSPKRLQPGVPRDLETICLKCLEKEPPKRYASALALAEDLRRFLNHEPIHARPIRLDERMGRWCRRNPIVATLLATVALTLLLGSVVATWFAIEARANAHQANTEKERAEANLKKARQAVHESFTLLSEAKLGSLPGVQPLRNGLLELASKYLQDLRSQAAEDPSLLTELA